MSLQSIVKCMIIFPFICVVSGQQYVYSQATVEYRLWQLRIADNQYNCACTTQSNAYYIIYSEDGNVLHL